MPDVVQGRLDEERSGLPTGARRIALVVALATAALLVSRSGLLSADAPDQPEGPVGPTARPEAARLVGVVDGHLVRPDQKDWSEGAQLPESLTAPMVAVPDPIVGLSSSRPGTLAGVADGLLFVVGTEPGATVRPIGRARSVVAATSSSLVVWRGARVVELDIGTGRVLDPDPFPGFAASAASGGWSPRGLVAVTGTHPLLMSRSLPDGLRQELALAWPARRVDAGTNPALQALGTFGMFLGIADDWVLTQGAGCPGTGCTVQVLSVTRDDVLVREVVPPDGWTFSGPGLGRTREALLPVIRDDEVLQALARVVPGGDSALVVGGTEGVDIGAGVVDTTDGDVYLIVRPPKENTEVLRVWRPGRSGRAALAPGRPELPQAARLVCVCG